MRDLIGYLAEQWAGRPVEVLSDEDIEVFAAALTVELDGDDPIGLRRPEALHKQAVGHYARTIPARRSSQSSVVDHPPDDGGL